MSKTLLTSRLRHLDQAAFFRPIFIIAAIKISSKAAEKKIAVSFSMFTHKIAYHLKF